VNYTVSRADDNESAAARHHADGMMMLPSASNSPWDALVGLRVNGDDFAAASSHQQDTLQTFRQHVQEVHICTTLAKEYVI